MSPHRERSTSTSHLHLPPLSIAQQPYPSPIYTHGPTFRQGSLHNIAGAQSGSGRYGEEQNELGDPHGRRSIASSGSTGPGGSSMDSRLVLEDGRTRYKAYERGDAGSYAGDMYGGGTAHPRHGPDSHRTVYSSPPTSAMPYSSHPASSHDTSSHFSLPHLNDFSSSTTGAASQDKARSSSYPSGSNMWKGSTVGFSPAEQQYQLPLPRAVLDGDLGAMEGSLLGRSYETWNTDQLQVGSSSAVLASGITSSSTSANDLYPPMRSYSPAQAASSGTSSLDRRYTHPSEYKTHGLPSEQAYAVPYAPARSLAFSDRAARSPHQADTGASVRKSSGEDQLAYGLSNGGSSGSNGRLRSREEQRLGTEEHEKGNTRAGSASMRIEGQDPGRSFEDETRVMDGQETTAQAIAADPKGFVACSTCRRRKIKCDGARPVCTNCNKKSYSCEFDVQLKRRGPDKEPGRRSKKFRSNAMERSEVAVAGRPSLDVTGRHTHTPDEGGRHDSALPAANGIADLHGLARWDPATTSMYRTSFGNGETHLPAPLAIDIPTHGVGTVPPMTPTSSNTMSCEMMAPGEILNQALHPATGVLTERGLLPLERHRPRGNLDLSGMDPGQGLLSSGGQEQGLWFDRLPDPAYARESDWLWMTGLFSENRAAGMRMIDREMRYFFDLGYLWFAFINRPLFFSALHHPTQHVDVQPALVLSMLAMSTLIKTSSKGPRAPGRLKAAQYADAARSMITQSILVQKVDPTLAQAALILAVFEACPHPGHETARLASAIKMMDGIIGMFQLLSIDVQDQRVSIFIPGDVPRVQTIGSVGTPITPLAEVESPGSGRATLRATWSPTPQWPTDWTLAETRKDEARRLCWTASAVAASLSHWLHTVGEAPLRLYLSTPENYALYFEAEASLIKTDPEAGKKTLWALYHRVILLWHYTVNLAHTAQPSTRRAWIVNAIWDEAGLIERELFDMEIDGGDLQKWQARDWLLAIKSLAGSVLPETASSGPSPMDMAAAWVTSQAEMAGLMRFASDDAAAKAPSVTSRPLFVWWFMIQLKHALDLYTSDANLVCALLVAEGFMQNVEAIRREWECPSLVKYYDMFKTRFQMVMARREQAGERVIALV